MVISRTGGQKLGFVPLGWYGPILARYRPDTGPILARYWLDPDLRLTALGDGP